MTRRELREHTFCMLFSGEFYENHEAAEQVERYVIGLTELNQDDQDERELDKLPKLTEAETVEMEKRVKDILLHIPELDEQINAVSEGWKTKRMGRVDLAIIRLALYEMKYDESVPVKVAINEAVELAKKYGGSDSPSFINGILAKLV